jgi:hypothetical protein
MAEREPFAVQAAKFSMWAPLILILINMAARMAGLDDSVLMAIGGVAAISYVVAFILGIVALFGIRKHGRHGILVRAVLGILINGLILGLAISLVPALAKARERARAVQAEREIKPFTFAAPAGFTVYPEGRNMFPDALHSYIKGDLSSGQPWTILVVEDLGGRIGKEDPTPFLQGRDDVSLLHEAWQGHRLPVIEIRETLDTMQIVTYNAQVPVLPKAVMVKVVGSIDRKAELQTVLRDALNGIVGSTNW